MYSLPKQRCAYCELHSALKTHMLQLCACTVGAWLGSNHDICWPGHSLLLSGCAVPNSMDFVEELEGVGIALTGAQR